MHLFWSFPPRFWPRSNLLSRTAVQIVMVPSGFRSSVFCFLDRVSTWYQLSANFRRRRSSVVMKGVWGNRRIAGLIDTASLQWTLCFFPLDVIVGVDLLHTVYISLSYLCLSDRYLDAIPPRRPGFPRWADRFTLQRLRVICLDLCFVRSLDNKVMVVPSTAPTRRIYQNGLHFAPPHTAAASSESRTAFVADNPSKPFSAIAAAVHLVRKRINCRQQS
jgi:hypothetical protein